jgi:hypothetical protein
VNHKPANRSRLFARAAVPLALALCTSAAVALAADKKPPPTAVVKPPAADSCAEAHGSVRLEPYGYTHVATLKNNCMRPVECAVWTNVDPEPRTTVRAQPGESVDVITRRGSPAREVSAMKSCTYR